MFVTYLKSKMILKDHEYGVFPILELQFLCPIIMRTGVILGSKYFAPQITIHIHNGVNSKHSFYIRYDSRCVTQ